MDTSIKTEGVKPDGLKIEGEYDSTSLNVDLDDVEILKICSRQDLFEMLRTDPEYYLKLIKDNNLGDELMIKVSRSSDGGGLRIKFRIYPEDRWTEVGYFGDCSDSEVLDDFSTQITALMSRSRKEVSSSRTGHLDSQLDANNDITSPDYGRDIPGLKQKRLEFQTPLEKQLDLMGAYDKKKKHSKDLDRKGLSGERRNSKHQKEVGREMRSEAQMSSVDSFLEELKTLWISQIISKLSSLVVFDEEAVSNLPKLLGELGNLDVPLRMLRVHEDLISRLHEHIYLVRLFQTGMFEVEALQSEMSEFLEGCLRSSPRFFMELKWDVIENRVEGEDVNGGGGVNGAGVLDEDDLKILGKYGLTIRQVWQEYLNGLGLSVSSSCVEGSE